MKIITILSATAPLFFCAQCKDKPSWPDVRFNVHVEDDTQNSIPQANIRLLYGHYIDEKGIYHNGVTNNSGNFSAKDDIIFSTTIWIKKDGFYPIRKGDLMGMIPEAERWKHEHDIRFVMREIKKPIPLYGRVIKRAIPEQNKPIGYDLKMADWVKPYGKGENVDMYFSFKKKHLGCKNGDTYQDLIADLTERHRITPRAKKEFLDAIRDYYENTYDYDYLEALKHTAGHWQGNLTITFPRQHEGIVEVKDNFTHYSELTMPHEAPENGYQSEWKREEDNNTNRKTDENKGYFLRTRVKLDEKGNIISANYTKLVTDFDFDPRGKIQFSYLLNPTPNDRNLEFDTKKNLFKELDMLEEIRKP
jgi:hypothetical protein